MAGELGALGARLGSIVDPQAQRRIVTAAGVAGKKGALVAAAADLGADRKFSGMRRKKALSAGFNPPAGSRVNLMLRPPGLWILAQSGRKNTKLIRRTKRRAPHGFRTPHGVRMSFTSKPSRGLGTIEKAHRQAHLLSGPASDRAVQAEIRRAMRG